MATEIGESNLRAQLEIIATSSNFAILQAQKELEASSVKLSNPKRINEELAYQKEIFSKLKFLYLEQETRDKFLRKISELTTDHIDTNDLRKIEEETIESKQNLKKLKAKMYQQIDDLDIVVDESYELYEQYEQKIAIANNLLGDISNLEEELEDLINDQELFDDSQIANDILQSGTEVSTIDQIVQLKKQELGRQQSELSILVRDLESKRMLNENQQKYIDSSTRKLEELQVLMSNSNSSKSLPDDRFQNYAKWCQGMSDIIIKFTDLKSLRLVLTAEDNFNLRISVGSRTVDIEYDQKFKLQKVTGLEDKATVEKFVNDVNSKTLGEDNFLKKLVFFINKAILDVIE
ncbi:uncharacterized protein RJT20DRAFT_41677 [Scheffersomyces xylosifermentans]|uniref:uncharacterized protein n=1 Tax=Scheffersomyces xylosifermentans TaxID=1304137 RepID=UPI00315D4F3C